jgi:hypothetical protein
MQPQKQPTLIIDRLKAQEELTNGLAAFVQNEIPAIKNALTNIIEVLNAFIAVSPEGTEVKVQNKLKEMREARVQAQADREKEVLAKAVADGLLESSDVVTEDSVVVGREISKEGDVLHPGRAQAHFTGFAPDAQKQLLGQGVGFVVTGTDGSFEVTEIYKQAAVKPAEVQAEAVSAEPVAEVAPESK